MKHRIKKTTAIEDIDLLPIMNLFSILIPVLLTMAVFHKVAIVELNMPDQSLSDESFTNAANPDLDLTLAITDSYLQVWAMGGSLSQIFYKELIEVRCKKDNKSRFNDRKLQKELRCADNTQASIHDIE